VDGDEVVQLYVGGGAEAGAPIRNLRGFQRIHRRAGEARQVTFTVAPGEIPKQKVEVSVGGGQPLPGVPHVKGAI
jgi:beta-glucosidase